MSSQIPGIPASGSSGVAGATSAARIAPARALVPVAPAAPRDTNPLSGTPLGRSGLDLAELLGTHDTVAARQRTPSVALEVGLEQARGALLRNLAGDALAALDNVWEGARRTEEGWYLRGSALTVLGLPGEGDRIAQEGLQTRPASTALRFLQSLARLTVGDAAGARNALQPALHTAPHDPLLLVQQAIVQARQGDNRGAEALLHRAMRAAPEHPALDYGRGAVRAATADVTRSMSRSTPPPVEAIPGAGDPSELGGVLPGAGPARSSGTVGAAEVEVSGSDRASDVVDGALGRFGARFVQADVQDVAREGRLLIRAFSAGGTLAFACSADQAHAARGLLTTVVGVLLGESAEGAPPLRALVQQILAALRDGRTVDAERALRRAGGITREPTVRLLRLLVAGALAQTSAATRGDTRAEQGELDETSLRDADGAAHASGATLFPDLRSIDGRVTPTQSRGMVQGQSECGPLVPVRLGLALLTETSEQRLAARGLVPSLSVSGPPEVSWPADQPLLDQVTGSYRTVPGPGEVATGWGSAYATAALHTPRRNNDLHAGAGVRAVALLCVGLAAAAMSTGNSAVAIALGIGAAWLALRRSGGRGGSGRPTADAGESDASERGALARDAEHATEPRR